MKKLILLSCIVISMSAHAQQISFIATPDPAVKVWSFEITGDTSILKPVDTTYAVDDNIARQTIEYHYQDAGKPMQLFVTNRNDGKFWRFYYFKIQTKRLKKK